jgi:hypothetical protein
MSLSVRACTLTGLQVSLRLEAEASLGDLYRAVEAALGLPWSSFVVAHRGRFLEPLAPLAAQGVASGDCVVLCFSGKRPREAIVGAEESTAAEVERARKRVAPARAEPAIPRAFAVVAAATPTETASSAVETAREAEARGESQDRVTAAAARGATSLIATLSSATALPAKLPLRRATAAPLGVPEPRIALHHHQHHQLLLAEMATQLPRSSEFAAVVEAAGADYGDARSILRPSAASLIYGREPRVPSSVLLARAAGVAAMGPVAPLSHGGHA